MQILITSSDCHFNRQLRHNGGFDLSRWRSMGLEHSRGMCLYLERLSIDRVRDRFPYLRDRLFVSTVRHELREEHASCGDSSRTSLILVDWKHFSRRWCVPDPSASVAGKGYSFLPHLKFF